MTVSDPADLAVLLRDAIRDPATSWSLGAFGAVAEFMRDADEPAVLRDDGLVYEVRTARGALRVQTDPAIRPVAYETAAGSGWTQAVALCLPADACVMSGRAVVAELGPDADAVAPEDRVGLLFDLGLALPQTDACVRSSDPAVVKRLRAGAGRTLFDAESPLAGAMPTLSPVRVFVGRIGRIEVSQPIPPPDGRSPEGPHTHVLPKLIAAGRTHAATAPIPDGWVPCLHLFPPHPAKDGLGHSIPFDRARHEAFQALLRRYGDPSLLALKQQVNDAVHGGGPIIDEDGLGRAGRMTVRATLRQIAARGDEAPGLADWMTRFDHPGVGEGSANSLKGDSRHRAATP